jgi:hypothetical protein
MLLAADSTPTALRRIGVVDRRLQLQKNLLADPLTFMQSEAGVQQLGQLRFGYNAANERVEIAAACATCPSIDAAA